MRIRSGVVGAIVVGMAGLGLLVTPALADTNSPPPAPLPAKPTAVPAKPTAVPVKPTPIPVDPGSGNS